MGAPAAGGTQHWEIILRADIGNVERAMLAHPAILWLINTNLDAANGYGTKMSPHNHSVSLAESQHHVINPTNSGRALDDGVEDRLHVGRRAADDAEHLGRCRLMLQGFAQFCVALLEFFEQPDVLDGDDGLVGEGFEQRDLLVRKGRTSVRRIKMAPIATPSRSKGATKPVRSPAACANVQLSGNSALASGLNIHRRVQQFDRS